MERAFVTAAAGCGKTHLLSAFVADERSGRQLILTHTNAGVAALRHRLAKQGVPSSKYSLGTIAGWSARLALSYPSCSGLVIEEGVDPNWGVAYGAAKSVTDSSFGQHVLRASYSGVVVDEYQDCTYSQHSLIQSVGRVLPCRGVGDPMQSIFGFNEPCVTQGDVRSAFEMATPLEHPWRWEREGANRELGAWLREARAELAATGSVNVTSAAPVLWIEHRSGPDVAASWRKACLSVDRGQTSAVALLQNSRRLPKLAAALKGLWSTTEAIEPEGRQVLRCAEAMSTGDPVCQLSALLDFLGDRITKMNGALKTVRSAVVDGRDTGRIKKYRAHLDGLQAFVDSPCPVRALAIIDAATREQGWNVYRLRSIAMLRTALRQVLEGDLQALPEAVTAERLAARYVGRRVHRRTVGTPLLVKGLEFDHAIVLCEPDRFTLNELYVALTRGSNSLTVVSKSRVLQPKAVKVDLERTA